MATSPPPQPPPKKKKPSPSQPQAPIIPWSHDETAQLIQAYEEKWYSLRRGPLKSAHWEEVAVTVAARCGHHDADHPPSSSSSAAVNSRPSKSALQCRHKMEKLRQRFRSESLRPLGPSGPASAWPFFVPMDRMLRGPFPISARPMADATASDDDDDGGEEDRDRGRDHNGILGAKSRSLDCILRRPVAVSRLAAPAKRPRRGGGEVSVAAELAKEIRGFGERLAAVERAKMEAAREAERFRMEMEGRRIEMILRSQNKIVDAIARVFGSPNRHVKEET